MASVEELLRSSTLYRRLSGEDQKRLAAAAILKWEAANAARIQNAEEGEFVQPVPDLVQLSRSQKS